MPLNDRAVILLQEDTKRSVFQQQWIVDPHYPSYLASPSWQCNHGQIPTGSVFPGRNEYHVLETYHLVSVVHFDR